MAKAAVFLDRDGTLNAEKQYLHRIEEWEWIPGAIEAIRMINRMGYLAVVVTNQAGIARGYYSEENVYALHRHVDEMLARSGARIDAWYYCPHHPEYGTVRNCRCRKPAPGMLFEAQREHDIDLSKSWLVGDKLLDIEAGRRAGVTPILVMTGYGLEERRNLDTAVACGSEILSAVRCIEKIVVNYNRIRK